MANRLSTSIVLATLGLAGYALAFDYFPSAHALLATAATHMQVGLSLAQTADAPAFLAHVAVVAAFVISLCLSYLAQSGRITRMAGGLAGLMPVHAAIIVGPAIALWLVLVYLSGHLVLIERLFPLWLAAITTALLPLLTYLRPRGPLETVGLALAAALVWYASPYRSFALLGYLLMLALAYAGMARRVGTPASLLERAATFIVIVAGAHLGWVLCFFLAGHIQILPIWLVCAAAAIMFTVGGVLPVAMAYIRNRDELSMLLYDSQRARDSKIWPQLVAPTAPSAAPGARRAWIISYTGVSNEPRVLRQCEALLADGWNVVVCGFDGHSPRPPQWTFVRLPQSDPFNHRVYALLARLGHMSRQVLYRAQGWPFVDSLARISHGANPLWLHISRSLVRLAKDHPELKADLVIAHDYHTSNLGYAIAKHYDAVFSIDVHEYAREQYSNDPAWVKWQRPTIIATQDRYLRHSDVTTVVCQGIAELLAKETPLKTPPVVIRNVPFKNMQTFRKTPKQITVLYHGDLSKPRDIHVAIASVPFWRPEFKLLLRGSGDADYVASLRAQIEELGIQDRVEIVPPVPFEKIVEKANEADIGFFSYTSYSPQIQFALPNKVFEYIMAGLAICISDLTEVGRVVNHYRNGYLIKRHTPEGIAETINSFDRDTIDAFKRASIAASAELNWEAERTQLLRAYHDALR